MTPKELLIKARGLIADPNYWMKGELDDGLGCFCTLGSIYRILEDTYEYPANPGCSIIRDTAVEALAKNIPKEHEEGKEPTYEADMVADYNDDGKTTHTDIMALFDRAIASLE